MLFPTKMEIVLHSLDRSDPATYLQNQVHPKLRPRFANKALNSGVYELVSSSNVPIPTYFFTFGTTTPANSANRDTLEIPRLSENRSAEVTDLLPEAEEILPKFVVPNMICSYHEVRVRIVEGKLEGKLEGIGEVVEHVRSLDPAVADSIWKHPSFLKYTSQPSPSPTSQPSTSQQPTSQPTTLPLAVKGNEDCRNQLLAEWLKNKLSEKYGKKFEVINNIPNEKKVSRYSLSNEDIAVYVPPEEQQSEQLSVGYATGPIDLEIMSTENKEEAKDSDQTNIK
jgi:hypothetical protein